VKFLDTTFASRETLKKELYSLLKIPDFSEQGPSLFDLVENLTGKLIDGISFVIEYPYVDRHYRDTYYTFYSSKFLETERECFRVHIFNRKLNKDNIFDRNSKINDDYLGFFIIRPLKTHILGRSLISPKAFQERKFVCCLMEDRVSLFGYELTICGFPHIAQDEETHTCAESALWCLYEYYGSKYSQYKPLLPSQIIEPLQNNAERRILPSRGLNKNELARCLNSNGFQSLVYPISPRFTKQKLFFRLLNTYIESGIPLLLTLEGEASSGHVVLVIGHEENAKIYYKEGNSTPWAEYASYHRVDVSFIQKKLIFIDDNLPPYHTDLLKPYQRPDKNPGLKYHNYNVSSFIVPLPAHMFLAAETVYDLVEKVSIDPMIGFEKRKEKKITRLLLTSSYSFKKFVFEHDNKMDPNFKETLFLPLAFPRFIWICEIYEKPEFIKDGYCSGLLIMDATSDGKSLASVLFYILDGNLFSHNGFKWDTEPLKVIPFKMQTYRNNLKGEWCEWMTKKTPCWKRKF
jgi:hypothetical protein